MSIAFAAYRLFGLAVRPIAPLWLARRAKQGKEDETRVGERFGKASQPRPAGRVAWVHAASVGETNAVMPVVDRLVAAGISVVFTSVTITSARIAAGRLPVGAMHQFSPLDITPWIGRFVDHWRPDFALFVESELWPATITRLHAAGIPQILVNARLSERSFAGWQRFGGVAKALFGKIALCLAQSAKDAERYRALGVSATAVTGNLKFDTPPPEADPAKLAALRALTDRRPVWLAASTHAGEESLVGTAHAVIRKAHPWLVTIVVPRHPPRGPEIAAELRASGLVVASRSSGEAVTPETDIYLADTLNELGLFYRIAPVAFIGGSITDRGGQNPIEPARLDCAILHGPQVQNFAEIYAALDQSGGAEEVADADGLAKTVIGLLGDATAVRRRTKRATEALAAYSGALEATMRALEPYVSPAAPIAGRATPARTAVP